MIPIFIKAFFLLRLNPVDGLNVIKQCTECGTYYLYQTVYKFLMGFGGSYDEYWLARLSDEDPPITGRGAAWSPWTVGPCRRAE